MSEERQLEVQNMICCVRRWITSYRKRCKERILQKMDSDISKVISAEDVAMFERSESARQAVKLCAAKCKVSQQDSRNEEVPRVSVCT